MNPLVRPVKLTVKRHPKADISRQICLRSLDCPQLRTFFGRALYGENVPKGDIRILKVGISVDGGRSWHPVQGTDSWSYEWESTELGKITLYCRAVDDSGNLEQVGQGVTVTIV